MDQQCTGTSPATPKVASKPTQEKSIADVTNTGRYQLLPPLSADEYQALKEDIRSRGMEMPVVLDERGEVIDGYHRLRIVEELRREGVKVDYKSIVKAGLPEQSKRSLSRALNLHRRHLSQVQRRALIEQQLRDTPNAADRVIARHLGVTDKTVAVVRRRLEEESAIPTVTERVRSDGKKYPSHLPSVITKSQTETGRALTVLSDIPATSLPNQPIDLRRLERIRREVKSAERAATIDEKPAVYGDCDIRFGDFRDVLADVPDGSADLILSDPPYAREFLPLWTDLADFAARVLRPGGLLVAYSGVMYLPEVHFQLSSRLSYVWTIAQLSKGPHTPIYARQVRNLWKPILIFANGSDYPQSWFDDVLKGRGAEKELHDWQQREDEARWLVQTFSKPGDLVIDPFLGSGTSAVACIALGRRFIGADVDAAAVSTSRERLQKVASAGEHSQPQN